MVIAALRTFLFVRVGIVPISVVLPGIVMDLCFLSFSSTSCPLLTHVQLCHLPVSSFILVTFSSSFLQIMIVFSSVRS